MRRKKRQPLLKTRFEGLAILLLMAGLLVLPSIIQNSHQSKVIVKVEKKIVHASPTPTSTPKKVVGQVYAESKPMDYCLTVPVLMYHHIQPLQQATDKGQTALNVDPITFDEHMTYLKASGYTAITSLELIQALKNHTLLPNKSVVITVDDGYKDVYSFAYPILIRQGLKATFMIPTGLVMGDDYVTWDNLREMKSSGFVEIANHTHTHHNMAAGSLEKMRHEILGANQLLEQNLNLTSNIFTYPYGGISDTAITVLQQEGFIGAFSTIQGSLQCESTIMKLQRTRIGEGHLSRYGL